MMDVLDRCVPLTSSQELLRGEEEVQEEKHLNQYRKLQQVIAKSYPYGRDVSVQKSHAFCFFIFNAIFNEVSKAVDKC
uniref:Uncharacterized protein n=1 Tax=Tetraselmis sp. GSL018 TaxID=582737 RepID=A0A061QVP7_9CHLO